jgi:hypothetical protein
MKKLFFLIVAASFFAPAIVNADESGKDWNFYGSARMTGFYWDRWMMYGDTVYNDPATYKEDQRLQRMIWDLEWMSRFGASIKKDKYSFRFEAGWGSTMRQVGVDFTQQSVSVKYRDGMVLRRLYGEWFINDYMTLLVGQEWCIANFFPSSQVFDMEDGLCYSGALYTGRKPQVKLTVGDQRNTAFTWKAEFALVKPDTFIVGTWTPTWNVEAEEKIPKMEGGATVEGKVDLAGIPFGAKLQLVAGINRYNLVSARNSPLATTRNLVKGNCEAANIDLTIWKCRLSFAYAQGTNLASYGVVMGNPWGDRSDDEIACFYPKYGTSVKDSLGLPCLNNVFTKQGCAVFNIKPLNFLALEVGAGKILNSPDALDFVHKADKGWGKNFDRRWAWYTNMQFSLLDGHMLLIPEFSYSDLSGGTQNNDDGIWKAYGLMLQFDM